MAVVDFTPFKSYSYWVNLLTLFGTRQRHDVLGPSESYSMRFTPESWMYTVLQIAYFPMGDSIVGETLSVSVADTSTRRLTEISFKKGVFWKLYVNGVLKSTIFVDELTSSMMDRLDILADEMQGSASTNEDLRG